MSDTATMYIDGAARGNPGPAAYAIVLQRPGQPVVEEADIIGKATNNVAEYTALIEGLTLATVLGVKALAVYSDSELMVKQINGEYRVKNEDLRPLYDEAKRLASGFKSFAIAHVRREQNKRADEIGNDALDGKPRKRGQVFDAGEQVGAVLSPPSHSGKEAGKLASRPVTDANVRDDVLDILRSAAQVWAAEGVSAVPVSAVWDQIWSVLEDGGVLKKTKK